tara:strand:- start:4576 stop:4821 length:246 start_codon:yes stop_codon:yes gene_type:complete
MFDFVDDPFSDSVDHGSFKNLYLEDYEHMLEKAEAANEIAAEYRMAGHHLAAEEQTKKAVAFRNCAESILAVAATIPMADA